MLYTILGLYLQGLIIAALLVIAASFFFLLGRVLRGADKTARERQAVFYELLMIDLMTIPILSFGIVGLLVMLKA